MTDKPDLGTPELHRRMRVENSGEGSRMRARVTNQMPIDEMLRRGTITEEQHWAGDRWWEDFERGGFWLYQPLVWDSDRGGRRGLSDLQMECFTRYKQAGAAISDRQGRIIARDVIIFGDAIREVRRLIRRRHDVVQRMLVEAMQELYEFYT